MPVSNDATGARLYGSPSAPLPSTVQKYRVNGFSDRPPYRTKLAPDCDSSLSHWLPLPLATATESVPTTIRYAVCNAPSRLSFNFHVRRGLASSIPMGFVRYSHLSARSDEHTSELQPLMR